MSAELTVTLHLWWLWAYLAVGVVSWLPLSYLAHRRVEGRGPFWPYMRWWVRWHGLAGSAWLALVQVVAWPLAAWEIAR